METDEYHRDQPVRPGTADHGNAQEGQERRQARGQLGQQTARETGNLDSKTGREIIELMRQINQQAGTTIIQVTHDREVAAQSDEIILFKEGNVVA